MTQAILPEFLAYQRSAEKMLDLLLRHRHCWCDPRRHGRIGVHMLIMLNSQRHGFKIGSVSVGDEADFATDAAHLIGQAEVTGDWSTGQLNNHAEHPAGVAIRTNVGLLAIMGLSKHLDEVLALAIAVDMRHLNRERARWILEQRSNNPHAGLLSQILDPQKA